MTRPYDAEGARESRIEHAKELRIEAEAEAVMRGGDNFRFVGWQDVTEMKLWSRAKE